MPSSDRGTVHIIGAGLAGLAAAVRLTAAGRRVVVHEATQYAGGRCRSYYDNAAGMVIDNGTHIVLSGNHSVLAYARTIGAVDELISPDEAEFPFIDLATQERWSVKFSDGRFPWWIFDKSSRVPDTRVVDYLPFARLAFTSQDRTLGETIDCSGMIYERLLEPIMLAALNIDPRHGSAKLASAVIRETIARGGKTCRPLLARNGIGNALVEPAVAYLRGQGIDIHLQDELLALKFDDDRVSAIELSGGKIELGAGDTVVLAVPPYIASRLVPGLSTPTEFRGILNAHFRAGTPAGLPRMLGVINGTVQWVFAMPGHVSVTISDAEHHFTAPRQDMAQRIWNEVSQILRLPAELPPWQIVRERRATFAATPQQNALRPGAETQWPNLVLAGDWTATGLPATLESAIRSGFNAADLASRRERAVA